MALDVAGLHAEAERAYEWLADIQRADGSWHNYYVPDGERDDRRSQARHQRVRLPGDRCLAPLALHRRPLLRRQHVADRRTRPGLGARRCGATTDCALWAIEPDSGRGTTRCSPDEFDPARPALRCSGRFRDRLSAARLGGGRRRDVHRRRLRAECVRAEGTLGDGLVLPGADRRVMDEDAKIRLGDGWTTFAMEGLGVRCVSDEPWVRHRRQRRRQSRSPRSATSPRRPICWRGHAGTGARRVLRDRPRLPRRDRVPRRRDDVLHGGGRDPRRRRDHRRVPGQRSVRSLTTPLISRVRPRRRPRSLLRRRIRGEHLAGEFGVDRLDDDATPHSPSIGITPPSTWSTMNASIPFAARCATVTSASPRSGCTATATGSAWFSGDSTSCARGVVSSVMQRA